MQTLSHSHPESIIVKKLVFGLLSAHASGTQDGQRPQKPLQGAVAGLLMWCNEWYRGNTNAVLLLLQIGQTQQVEVLCLLGF